VSRALNLASRASGVLLHPTSLPAHGIGDLGPVSLRFLDWLAEAGQSYWQILPLGPVDTGGSPYNGLSALAGNPLLISPELLVTDGLLAEEHLHAGMVAPGGPVDYPAVHRWKEVVLVTAHRAFRRGAARHLAEPFEAFRTANEAWLADYALFRAVRDHHREVAWIEWPREIRNREPEAVERWRGLLAEEVERYSFQQFLFDRQWRGVRDHAHHRGIQVIGDLPIFVAHDSADVWANPEIFQLDAVGLPTVVAGVPPDYFSETGQRWGNPLYRWDVLRTRAYDWWVERFRRTFALVDVVRIDHFRGFESYWEIPVLEETAVRGRWVEGPGAAFFQAVEKELGPLPVIAEDLGLITAEVEALREELGFPGMRVLEFAFDGDARNPHLPENYVPNAVAYTGTHDNDTVASWWASAPAAERKRVRKALGLSDPGAWNFVEAVFDSQAGLAIVPLQDVLGLGREARMNTPGSSASNWTWRLEEDSLAPSTARALLDLTRRSGRWRGGG
jgi:4-alpha-glucanotransferase